MNVETIEKKTSQGSVVLHTEVEKKDTNVTNVAVIGLGYVGLPLAILSEIKNYNVIGFDIDKKKISALEKREADFLSAEEKNIFKRSRIRFYDDEQALSEANIFIICVPTPVHEDHTPDLKPLESACFIISKYVKKGSLVLIESTVNPGACEEVALPIIEKGSNLKAEHDFYFAHCPERINPGDENWNVHTIPRVIGALGPKSLESALMFYKSILDGEILPMNSIKEAEAVKMVENSFRDINIAFVNELAMSFSKTGIDIMNVIRGASSKPFAFMPHYPGCGVGGHCIPVDPYYLIRYGHQNGFEHRFLIAAREINSAMPHYTIELLKKALQEKRIPLRNATIALLGLAYKRDVSDLRESPALEIRDELVKRGARVRSFDPYLPGLSSVKSLEEALTGAHAVLVATDHTHFQSLSPQNLLKTGVSIVIDGRNCLSKEEYLAEGIIYRGIGR